jgi:hypothetical protein
MGIAISRERPNDANIGPRKIGPKMSTLTDAKMTATVTAASTKLAELLRTISRVVKGKDDVIQLALTTLLARGHLLIEDVPGVGKTTLAQALAR